MYIHIKITYIIFNLNSVSFKLYKEVKEKDVKMICANLNLSIKKIFL